MKLSIIIPAYNVEKYITRCLESILSQDVDEKSYEVIVINDGSKDHTEDIVKRYTNSYSNVKLINQVNQGASVARNVGLKLAQGELIWFVDADDAVTNDSLKSVPEFFQLYPHADFLLFDRYQCYEDYKDLQYFNIWGGRKDVYGKPLSREEAVSKLKTAVNWHFVYRRDYLIQHDLFLYPGIINEDNEYVFRVFFFAKEIRYIPYAHYIYTLMRTGSVTTVNFKATEKRLNAALTTLDSWKQFADKYVKTEKDARFYYGFRYKMIIELLLLKNSDKQSDLYRTYLLEKRSWRKWFISSFFKARDFSIKNIMRLLVVLFYPQHYKQ